LPPPEGHFYPWQLEGCRVLTEDGRDVGRVLRVEPAPAQDLWVVGDEAREHLVPAVPEIVLDVDIKARRVVIRPPDGLLDLSGGTDPDRYRDAVSQHSRRGARGL